MTLGTVALRYLQDRLVASALTVVSIALGVSLVIASVLLTRGIKDTFVEGTTDYSLVVGAKGSPTQLVLNVVFRMDSPTFTSSTAGRTAIIRATSSSAIQSSSVSLPGAPISAPGH